MEPNRITPAPIPAPAPGFAPRVEAPRQFSRLAPLPLQLVRDPLRITLFLLTLLTVSRVHQHYRFIAAVRPAFLLMIVAAGIVWMSPRSLAGNVLATRPAKLVALFGLLACGSAVFGISQGSAGNFIIGNFSKTLIYCFLLIAAIRNSSDLFTIAYSYVLSCGILVLFAQFVFGLSRAAGTYADRLSDMYTYDANDLGLVLLIGLALALWLIPTASRPQKLLLSVIVCGIGATIARTGSRGALVGMVVFALALLFIVRSVSAGKRVGLIAVMGLALAFGAPNGYWKQMATMLQPDKDYNVTSADGRKGMLTRGLEYMSAYPAFGIGIANFQKAECTISDKAIEHARNTRLRCMAPHNSYVQAGAEMGVPGLLVWCAMVFGGVAGMLKLRRRMPRAWRFGDSEQRFLYNGCTYVAIALISFSVTSFFLSFAYMDPIYIMSALMAGLFTSARHRVAREQGALRPMLVPQPGAPTRVLRPTA